MKKNIFIAFLSLIIIVIILLYQNYAIVRIGGQYYLLHTSIKDFEYISDYPIEYCSNLNKFSQMETLNIRACNDFNLLYLKGMDKLHCITIYYPNGYYPESLIGLDSMPNLNELNIAGNYNDTFSIITNSKINYNNIEKLSIDMQRNVDFKSIRYFNNINILDIYVYEQEISSLDCLANLSNLETMTISAFVRDLDLSGLQSCKNLKYLDIENRNAKGYLLQDSLCFENLDSIIELTLENIFINDISGILQMDSLKVLHISSKCIYDDQIAELENKGIKVDLL